MLIGTIDFYHFEPISLALAFPGVTRSAQSKTYWLHFVAHLSSEQAKNVCDGWLCKEDDCEVVL